MKVAHYYSSISCFTFSHASLHTSRAWPSAQLPPRVCQSLIGLSRAQASTATDAAVPCFVDEHARSRLDEQRAASHIPH